MQIKKQFSNQSGLFIPELLMTATLSMVAILGIGYAIYQRNLQSHLAANSLYKDDLVEDFRRKLMLDINSYASLDGTVPSGKCIPGEFSRVFSHGIGIDAGSVKYVTGLSAPSDATDAFKEAAARCSSSIIPDLAGTKAHFCLQFSRGSAPAHSFLASEIAFAEVRAEFYDVNTMLPNPCSNVVQKLGSIGRPVTMIHFTLHWKNKLTKSYSMYSQTLFGLVN